MNAECGMLNAEREEGDSSHLPERPEGCFAQMGTVPFFPVKCREGVVHRSSFIIHHSRRGISLLEVLISMGILTVGLLMAAALIPLGALSVRETMKSDRTGACGRAGIHDVKVRRMLDSATWSSIPSAPTFVIDPLYYSVNHALPNVGPLQRLTFSSLIVGTPPPTQAQLDLLAEQVFRWRDDPLFVRPSDWKGATAPPNGDRPAGLFVQADGSTSAGPLIATPAYDPTFSWFLTAAPVPTDPTGRLCAVSVVVCYQRVLTQTAGVPDGERTLDVTITGGGYSGGTISVTNNNAAGTRPVVLKENQWVLLRAVSGTQCYWYRIVSGNSLAPTATGYVSLVGPDWNTNPATGGSATATLVAIDGVTGVYTTNVQLDNDPIWTR